MRQRVRSTGRRSRRRVCWLVAALIPILAVVGLLWRMHHQLSGTTRHEILAAIKRDPMASYRPPRALAMLSSTEREDSSAFGFRNVASASRSWRLAPGDAELAYLAALAAARRAGWSMGPDPYLSEEADIGEIDSAVSRSLLPEPPPGETTVWLTTPLSDRERYGLVLSIGLYRLIPKSGNPTPRASTPARPARQDYDLAISISEG